VKNRVGKWSASAGLAAVVALGAGCASTKDLNAVRADLDSLRGETAAVRDTASGAMAGAEAARNEAGEASRTANRALGAAREAQAGGAANSERIERMFKKSMMK